MRTEGKKIEWIVFLAVIAVLSFLRLGFAAAEEARVTTDKNVYRFGEPVYVTFFNAPGLDRDWICIVGRTLRKTAGGDYQYLPKDVPRGHADLRDARAGPIRSPGLLPLQREGLRRGSPPCLYGGELSRV